MEEAVIAAPAGKTSGIRNLPVHGGHYDFKQPQVETEPVPE